MRHQNNPQGQNVQIQQLEIRMVNYATAGIEGLMKQMSDELPVW